MAGRRRLEGGCETTSERGGSSRAGAGHIGPADTFNRCHATRLLLLTVSAARQILPGHCTPKAAGRAVSAVARRLRSLVQTALQMLTAPLPPRLTVSKVLRSLVLVLLLLAALPAAGQVRIKDIADVEGVRENQLIGYGLVVGLNNTGDKLDNAVFTRESLIGMLERLGVNTRDQVAKLSTKNIAAVMVTAELPAFARSGSRIDVAVSALGDATNLTGGTLLVTPLLAADGEVYAVAQGALSTGAIAARGAASSVTRGVPTAGRIANGATVEREVQFRLDKGLAL